MNEHCIHEPIDNEDDNNSDEGAFHVNYNITIENSNTTANIVHNIDNVDHNYNVSNTVNGNCNSNLHATMESTTSMEPSQHPLSAYQVKQNEQDDTMQSNSIYNNNDVISNNNNNDNNNCVNSSRVHCSSVTCDSKSFAAFRNEFVSLIHYCCSWMFIFSVVAVAAWSLAGNACRIALHNAFQHQRFFVTYEYFGPNCIGCFVMGCLVVLLPNESDLPLIHRALCVGFCGSFTTFSGWVLDVTNKHTAAGAFEELISGLTLPFIFFILGRDMSLALLYVLEWGAALCHVHLFHLVPTDQIHLSSFKSNSSCHSVNQNIHATNANQDDTAACENMISRQTCTNEHVTRCNADTSNNNNNDNRLLQEGVHNVHDNEHHTNTNRLPEEQFYETSQDQEYHQLQRPQQEEQEKAHPHYLSNPQYHLNNLHRENELQEQKKAVLTSHEYKEEVKAHRRRHQPCVFITSLLFLLVSVAAAIAVPIAIQVRINQNVIRSITDAQLKAVVMAPAGAVVRYCLAVALNKRAVIKCFPLGTLLANVLGVFIGVFVDNYAFRRSWNAWYWIALNGVCGALSTVSSFVNEVHGFYISHQFVMAYFYLCVSVVITVTIAAIGRRDNY